MLADCEQAGLNAGHFTVDGHRNIYIAMKYLYESSQVPEPLAILEVLADNSAKESVNELGGLTYLTALTKAPAVDRNIDIYVKKLLQTYTRKSIVGMAEEVANLMISDSSKVLNPLELIGTVQKRLDDIADVAGNQEEVHVMGIGLEERLKQYAEAPVRIAGLETGFPTFDIYTGGMGKDDLLFICAPSKTGKSVALTNFGNKIAIHDKLPILYIDTEMSSEAVETRLLSMNSGVPEKEIENGMFTQDTEYGKAEDKTERLKRASALIQGGNFHHVYMPGFDMHKIEALTRKYKMKYGIVALFFDYIKLPQNDSGRMQEYQRLGQLASQLKDLGGKLQIPIFSAVQANRSKDRKDVDDFDENSIGGSYRILQLASKLAFLVNKPEIEYAKNPAMGNQTLKIAFQRNGACDCPPINIMFSKPIIRMEEC